ncbi:MAG: FAD-dependent oxidoreductase [Candidatus Lokiarchaeota archaeon]|nr:FAD-dependent oxidoreductase [Candidatus Lokiarchaeota archaeon]
MEKISHFFDVVVCGGGIGGVCAALASARSGLKTALIQNRSVLGGNASSEVRVHMGGACHHGYHYDAREPGIIEELRLDIAVRDPKNEYFWIDEVLYSKCYVEPKLSLFLNTNVFDIKINKKKIQQVIGIQIGTEKIITFTADMFIDGTGDGILAHLAGAECRIGREPKDEFNESLAPDNADKYTLGSTIMFQARDLGRHITYAPPSWAKKFTTEQLKNRKGYGKSNNFKEYWHSDTSGWWWVEYGGILDSIKENESIKHELQSIVYGLWDWIKNHDKKRMEESKNFEITWISQVPGKRESRRVIGDYILKESDLIDMLIFEDQVAVGGWSIDLHPPKGFYSEEAGAKHKYMDLPYSIPFRSIYSKDISNLLIASRCISVSHVAHASTRLIATLGVVGQAAGTAASLCKKYSCTPRELGINRMKDLQQELLKNDQYLLGIQNEDANDKALSAKIYSSSEHQYKFGDPTTYIPLYFPMAQRFYVYSQNQKNRTEKEEIFVFLKNSSDEKQTITGGIRADGDRFEFESKTDLFELTGHVDSNATQWVKLKISNNSKEKTLFREDGNYWLYLNENPDVAWGKNNNIHWPGFRVGYINEQTEKWQVVRINGNIFFDDVIGFFGHFCFKIKGLNSPFPAAAINNGQNRPFIRPNIWISQPFAEKITENPKEINNMENIESDIEVYIEFNELTSFKEIWFIFDTELNNSYPHQSYGKERIKDWPIGGKSPKCIRKMKILYENKSHNIIDLAIVDENYQRQVKLKFKNAISAYKIILKPLKTWGFHCFNLYEIRIY